MSALSDLYRDESDTTEEEGSSFADEAQGRGSEASEEEETLEDFGSEDPTADDEEDEDDTDRRNSDEEDESQDRESGSERDRDGESDEERDRSSNRESEDESDSRNREEDESDSQNVEEEDRAQAAYDTDSDGEDEDGERDRGIEYGEDYTDNFNDEPDLEKPVAPRGAGSGGMSSSQKTCFFCWCLICMVISLVAGAVIGAILTEEDTSFAEVLGIESSDNDEGDECRGVGVDPTAPPPPTTPDPIPQEPPTGVFGCPEDNANLEFRIIFDAKPGEVGLRVTDPFGLDMWGFPAGSFGSFALLLRENIFTLCLSPNQEYTFEVTDSGSNGFISKLGADVFGSFSLLYAEELVTTYHGNCNATNSIECGNFCKCTYSLAVNASSGACTTACDDSTTAAPSSTAPTIAPAIPITALPTATQESLAPTPVQPTDVQESLAPTTGQPTGEQESLAPTTLQPTDAEPDEEI